MLVMGGLVCCIEFALRLALRPLRTDAKPLAVVEQSHRSFIFRNRVDRWRRGLVFNYLVERVAWRGICSSQHFPHIIVYFIDIGNLDHVCALHNPNCAADYMPPFTIKHSLYQLVSYKHRTGMLAGSKGTARASQMRDG